MKKILILGATLTQVPLIRTAKALGYYTIVASIDGDYPGFKEADEICYVDISDPESVLVEARRIGIDGVATCCMDTPVRAVGYVCEHLGLCGLSEESARICNDKYLMKDRFVENGVNTARYFKANSRDEVKNAMKQLNTPVVIKAVDLQASRGVFIVNSEEEALQRFEEIKKMSKHDYCIIEEFIDGIEFGAQAFVYNGEILFVLPHGDFNFCITTNVPVGHYAPLDQPEHVIKAATECATDSIKALGLNNCAINIDMIYKDGKVYMLELTGRAGATCLPELVSIYYGIDYYKMIVMMAMGENPLEEFNKRSNKLTANASHFLYIEKDGILKQIINNNKSSDGISQLEFFVKPGDKINSFVDGKDKLGQIIVKGEDISKCKELLDCYMKNIEFELE